jgi:hypothetical protein
LIQGKFSQKRMGSPIKGLIKKKNHNLFSARSFFLVMGGGSGKKPLP